MRTDISYEYEIANFKQLPLMPETVQFEPMYTDESEWNT